MKTWLSNGVKKTLHSILVIVAMSVLLPGCKKSPSPSPVSTSGMPYAPPKEDAPLKEMAAEDPYPPSIMPTTVPETPELTPTPLEPPGALNRKDPLSLVHWLQYGLKNQDLSYISALLADNVRYSLAFSDHPGEILTKETFLSMLERRLSNATTCISYDTGSGEINRFMISTEGWTPAWEFNGEEWDYLVLDFSDQWTKDEGLYLFGAYVSHFPGTNDPDEKPCP